ncbi:MAG: peptidylprolyl isomerase [Candidatus Eremiobacteraeota bacterium]|nr:peptidylprolyl isomerase [Candidatus Eremiobacteraeota bacterium]
MASQYFMPGDGPAKSQASAVSSASALSFFVYVLACRDGSLYTGWTNDLTGRLDAHRRGLGSRYVRSRLPAYLLAWWDVPDRRAALREEARFKALSRADKFAALEAGQVFGRMVRNAPATSTPAGESMAARTAPTGTELDELATEAKTLQARIHTARGDLVFSFYPVDARQHSAAFVKLARDKFYDGLKFHRYEPGFVIQGGCPEGTGTGGPGYNLDAEFNNLPHVKGTVAMARANSPHSAGSQFYICLGDARFLDKQYTVFGQLTEGTDVLDKLRAGDVMESVTIEPKAA